MCKDECVQDLHAAYQALPSDRKGSEYVCILFKWQLCEGAATRSEDWGHLVFTDMTTKKFIVVEVDTFAGEPPADLQRRATRKGQQLYALLTYLGYDPEWVRCATYRGDRWQKLPAGLLDQEAAPREFTQIDASTFKPCLSASLLDKCDTIVDRDQSVKKMVTKYRNEVGGAAALRQKVLATRTDPEDKAARKASPKMLHSCAKCKQTAEEAGRDALLRCSACKMVFYCGKQCQTTHWKIHKPFCKQQKKQ